MMSKEEYRYIKHKDIDKKKWDCVIENSPNGLVYAMSWYLDIVSPNWDAIIIGNYETVMPIPVKKKFGIRYIVQPPFCQQLGVFSRADKKINIDKFIKILNRKHFAIRLQLNPSAGKNNKFAEKKNYELDLNNSHEVLYQSYGTNARRNIKKVSKEKLRLNKNISIEELFEFKKSNPVNDLSKWHYEKQYALIEEISSKKMGHTYGVIDGDGNLLSCSYFMEFKDRLIMLVSSSSTQGKEKYAAFFMIDSIIKSFAGTNYILDFEGGNNPGLERFFSGFGAKVNMFYTYNKRLFF